ncbi:MAG TPA: hypothetical protein DF774_02455 [Rheinheimera sp.]|nr:hypothetical protein [Rheinheimera sp.]
MQLSFKNYKNLSIPRTLPLGECRMMSAPGCGSAAWRNSLSNHSSWLNCCQSWGQSQLRMALPRTSLYNDRLKFQPTQ